MTNREKYLDEMIAKNVPCLIFAKRIGEIGCNRDCDECERDNLEWLQAEYIEEKKPCKHDFKIEGIEDYIFCNNQRRAVYEWDCNDCEDYEVE